MAKEIAVAEDKRKELVKEMLVSKGPRMMKLCMDFIEEHFNSEDKDYRRDSHKLFGKWFDSQIPKTQIIETNNGAKTMDKRLEAFINMMSQEMPRMIEVEEAQIIGESEAKEVRGQQ